MLTAFLLPKLPGAALMLVAMLKPIGFELSDIPEPNGSVIWYVDTVYAPPDWASRSTMRRDDRCHARHSFA